MARAAARDGVFCETPTKQHSGAVPRTPRHPGDGARPLVEGNLTMRLMHIIFIYRINADINVISSLVNTADKKTLHNISTRQHLNIVQYFLLTVL